MTGALISAAIGGLLIGVALGVLIVRGRARCRARRDNRRRHAAILDSLDVLGRSLLQGQVDASEASIRISVLLDCLPPDIQPKADLAAIHRLADDCAGFARGDARRALKPMERHRQDFQRLQLEEEQADAVQAAARRLSAVLDEWRRRLEA